MAKPRSVVGEVPGGANVVGADSAESQVRTDVGAGSGAEEVKVQVGAVS